MTVDDRPLAALVREPFARLTKAIDDHPALTRTFHRKHLARLSTHGHGWEMPDEIHARILPILHVMPSGNCVVSIAVRGVARPYNTALTRIEGVGTTVDAAVDELIRTLDSYGRVL